MRFDITIPQGTTWRLAIPVLNSESAPQALAGWTAAGQVRETARSTTVLHDWDLSLAGSTVTITVPAATSTAWVWDYGVYDIELTDPDGNITRLVEGTVTVTPEVTR